MLLFGRFGPLITTKSLLIFFTFCVNQDWDGSIFRYFSILFYLSYAVFRPRWDVRFSKVLGAGGLLVLLVKSTYNQRNYLTKWLWEEFVIWSHKLPLKPESFITLNNGYWWLWWSGMKFITQKVDWRVDKCTNTDKSYFLTSCWLSLLFFHNQNLQQEEAPYNSDLQTFPSFSTPKNRIKLWWVILFFWTGHWFILR